MRSEKNKCKYTERGRGGRGSRIGLRDHLLLPLLALPVAASIVIIYFYAPKRFIFIFIWPRESTGTENWVTGACLGLQEIVSCDFYLCRRRRRQRMLSNRIEEEKPPKPIPKSKSKSKQKPKLKTETSPSSTDNWEQELFVLSGWFGWGRAGYGGCFTGRLFENKSKVPDPHMRHTHTYVEPTSRAHDSHTVPMNCSLNVPETGIGPGPGSGSGPGRRL